MDGCRHIYVMQGSPRCSFVVQESRWSGEKDHGSGTCRAAFPVHWPHQPYDAVRLMGDARRLALIPIGSASCRARGCPSVLISVVAVSLKNKEVQIKSVY